MTKTNHSVLFHTKHINPESAQNAALLNADIWWYTYWPLHFYKIQVKVASLQLASVHSRHVYVYSRRVPLVAWQKFIKSRATRYRQNTTHKAILKWWQDAHLSSCYRQLPVLSNNIHCIHEKIFVGFSLSYPLTSDSMPNITDSSLFLHPYWLMKRRKLVPKQNNLKAMLSAATGSHTDCRP